MSEAHLDEYEHYNFDQDKAVNSGHSGRLHDFIIWELVALTLDYTERKTLDENKLDVC